MKNITDDIEYLINKEADRYTEEYCNTNYDIVNNNVHVYYKNNDLNILHFPGKGYKAYKNVIKNIINNTFTNNDIDIITTYTDSNKCFLKFQCLKNNINLINSIGNKHIDTWYMPNKIDYILDALYKCTNNIVLILDGYDSLILNLDNIIEKFTSYNNNILYSSDVDMFPNIIIDDNYYINSSPFLHICAGACIGYREDLIKFYEECKYYKDYIYEDNIYNSEQFIIRSAIHNSNNKYNVGIDYNNFIFLNLHNPNELRIEINTM